MDAYIGEIRPFGFNFAPIQWATCDGQIIPISQNTALFAIIGTFYGGNGTSTFGLPNFQGRVGVNQGQGTGLSQYVVGEMGGFSSVTLMTSQLPLHNHVINTQAGGTATQSARSPTAAAFLGSSNPDALYSDQVPNPSTAFSQNAIGLSGSSMPHDNMQPFEALLFCICEYGVFPSRN